MGRHHPLPHEPDWPDEAGPFVFLLDAATRLERELLEDWIERRRPDDETIVHRIPIPPARRRRRRARVDPRLAARLEAPDDPLLVPLRVVWLAPERDGRRRLTLRDVLLPGDPRDPDPLRQRWILAAHPNRVRVVLGEPARAHELRRRWQDPHGRGPVDGTSFAEFVALRAWLSLERAERALRGNRYKVPKFLREDLYWSRGFQQGVARLALEHREKLERMQQRTWRYLKEIAATHSPYVIDIVAGFTGWLISRAYRALDYSPAELRSVYEAATDKPIVFLPSHKSNFDHLVLQYVLYENEYPPNHTAGGINMNFFPVGPFLRRSGIFFIRREFKDDEPYKFVLRQYLTYLLEKRFPLEWYIEGGRSRSGKLREPRLGLLAYVVDAYVQGFVDDVVFVPVSIAYDQIADIASYAAEQRGAAKEKESFAWMLRTVRSLQRRQGDIYVRWGEPLSLAERLAQGTDLSTERGRLVVPKLAFEIATRINAATPITPISLVAAALLRHSPRAVDVEGVLATLEPFLDYVKRRELPTTVPLTLDTPERVRDALDALAANGIVRRHESVASVVYAVGPEQHLAAAYYRNTIIHFFVTAAIAEVALVGVLREGTPGWSEFAQEAFALR
ncbi:MAG TPA: glycerol-3-phosphate acyltransferase, partial [Actinobacteria bacterium]|nr:glycerol-3-phosphate acyltransferase [Actinomycetota bacterium]